MAQQADMTGVLTAAQSGDQAVRTQAEAQLENFRQANYPGYVMALTQELANPQKPPETRQLAGVMLKNLVDAKEDARKAELLARWTTLPPDVTSGVKSTLLATLQMEPQAVRHIAAMATAKIAGFELPKQGWPVLINTLLGNMSAQPSVPGVRQATLVALGYLCEELATIKGDVLSPAEINMMLTAIVAGMRPEETHTDTRLAATEALSNAIVFAEHNFDNDQERNYIMQMVMQGTQAADARIRAASFQCLHEIASSYYSKLPAYMQDIFSLTVTTIRKEQEEDVALQAIEFWCTLCDYEQELADDEADGRPSEEQSHQFIKAVCPHLVPVLLEQLTKQQSEQELSDEEWNIAMAAGTALGLMAKLAGDAIVPLVMPFVQNNISKTTGAESWRAREAATFALGSILEGPSPAALAQLVKSGLSFLLGAMKDSSFFVKDTTAWTIGRIFEFLHNGSDDHPLISQDQLPGILSTLLEALKEPPHIAHRVCDTIGHLAEGYKNYPGNTSPLSPFFRDIITSLLQCAQRFTGWENAAVQIAAFEAINDCVRAASADTLDVVAQLQPLFVQEISKTFDAPITSEFAREKQAELQGQLCGVLQVLMQKLSESDATKSGVLQYGDLIMQTLLRIFSNNHASVHEEAMLAVGAFTYACGPQFKKYMPSFMPYLKAGLLNYKDWVVCKSTVAVFGDVCRNVEAEIGPYVDEILAILFAHLNSQEVPRKLKPQIINTIGDVALVVGDAFEKHLAATRAMFAQAMRTSAVQAQALRQSDSGDDEFWEWNNELRLAILDGYTSLFQGLSSPLVDRTLKGEASIIVEFIATIGADADDVEESVARAAVNLLGDMCSVVPNVGQALVTCPMQDWQKLVRLCQETELQNGSDWACARIDAAVRNARQQQ